jgi:hypothetical protein
MFPLGMIHRPVRARSSAAPEPRLAGTVSVYSGITGPGSFGPGGFVTASSDSGDTAAVNGSMGVLGPPTDYVSGSALSNDMVFTGQTFASLGLTPGTYTWIWGSGAAADSLTVQICAAAVPEPASALLVPFKVGP